MKLLVDQDVWAATTRFLTGLGHEVLTVASIGRTQADDSDLLAIAQVTSPRCGKTPPQS